MEQETELIAFLKSIGMEGVGLEDKLRTNLALKQPRFSIDHSIAFDKEMMFFRLHFRNDPQFNAYRLDRYTATFRDEIVISHKNINGIDTASLEEKMMQYDWTAFFSDQAPQFPNEEATRIIRVLNKLSDGQNFDGMEIQGQLMFKYWPEHVFEHDNKPFLKNYYESSRDFVPNEIGCCNANLAYHILSDRLGNLYESLSGIGLEQFPGVDLYPKLEQFLSDNPGDFKLNFDHNSPESNIEMVIPIKNIDGWYEADHYTITLRPYPPIEHVQFNGVDSRELEKSMNEINWHNSKEVFIYHEGREPGFHPHIDDIQQKIFQLGQSPDSSEIAQQLQLKYWTNIDFFGDTIQQSAWDYLEKLPKREQSFPVELKAKAACNLLNGRAVWIDPAPGESEKWTRLDLNSKDSHGNYIENHTGNLPKVELEKLMDLLPLENSSYYPIRNSILIGDITKVALTNGKSILIKADPERNTLNIFATDGRPIPFNFRFDPDWKPEQTFIQQQLIKENDSQKRMPKVRLNNSYKKNKGKGL